jgi:predicted TPR repeat methyltransferase
MTASYFQSSGDLIADRRYGIGQDLAERGDVAGAADLFAQAVELAPAFASAWFALGDAHERLGQPGDAIYAFHKALALDPYDRHGAGLHLVRLRADGLCEMPTEYVRTLFDQYAARFDTALVEGLSYRGPELLADLVKETNGTLGRRMPFRAALDLGCGTGLGGAAVEPFVDQLVGVDLSPKMIEQARGKGLYDRLAIGDLLEFLRHEADAAFDLVLAADVFAYFADLAPLAVASARVLERNGLFAFSAETYAGDAVILGDKLRYAHSREHVRAALARAGLKLLKLDDASTRNEGAAPVPGLIALAAKD